MIISELNDSIDLLLVNEPTFLQRLLTLPSGWRIQFGNNVNFIFETHDLSNASPATISRMGIVNLSEVDLDPSIIIETWLKKQPNSEGIQYLMEEFYRSIDYIDKLKHKSMMSSKVGLIISGLEFLNDCVNKEQFCVGLARGLGSTLRQEDLNGFCLNVMLNLNVLGLVLLHDFYNRFLIRLTFTFPTKTRLNYAVIIHSKTKLNTTARITPPKMIK